MNYLADALPWVAFWFAFSVLIYVEHNQYMAGHETLFFKHNTPEEIRIREAIIKKLEKEAK